MSDETSPSPLGPDDRLWRRVHQRVVDSVNDLSEAMKGSHRSKLLSARLRAVSEGRCEDAEACRDCEVECWKPDASTRLDD